MEENVMKETTLRFLVDFREKGLSESSKHGWEGLSLGELLYWVMFGDGAAEQAQAV